MSRKLRLTPLQRDILWMLEEAGAESLPTIVATVKPTGMTLGREIDGLVAHGLVEYYRDLNRPQNNYVKLTAEEIKALPDADELLEQPVPELETGLMLTELGHAALVN